MDEARKRLMAQTLAQAAAISSIFDDRTYDTQEQPRRHGMSGKQWSKRKANKTAQKRSRKKNRG